jgi:regulator of protease activity HflC (stomatin/prohibitin superfamily)
MLREKAIQVVHGFVTLPFFLALNLAGVWLFVGQAEAGSLWGIVGAALLLLAAILGLAGHFVVQPNQGRVLQLFGAYVGTVKEPGLRWANPFSGAMLQREQASAVVAARQKIVEGAVGMVESALDMLARQRIVQLDEERKAAMVSNLLVVLCADRATQPVVNTGSLYQ